MEKHCERFAAVNGHILSIDQSTSATKVLLFTTDGTVVDSASREHRQHYPQPGWVEHDAQEIWQNVLAALSDVVARQRHAIDSLLALSLTNQRETIVVFERTTGNPAAPAIVWQCRRSEALCAEHAASGASELIQAKTGLRLDAYFSGSKLQWLIRHRPALRARLESSELIVGTIDTYLIFRLTNGAVFATDPTNASRTLLFDTGRLQWDDALCTLWQVPRHALAEVRESADPFGETDCGGLLPKRVPIRGVMGDSQAALFAQRCFERGAAKVTFGTGSSVLLNIGRDRSPDAGGAVTALAWVVGGVPTYALEGLITFSAATLTWLRDQLGILAQVEEAEALALAAGDDHGVYLVPAFSGLAAPHWSDSARGAIVGLTAHSDRRHIVRAGLEAISYQVRDALRAMQERSGVTLTRLHGDGGAVRNRFLMQFTADVAGVPLAVASSEHQSPAGAAMMCRLGLMGLKNPADLPDPQLASATLYRPSRSPDWVQAHCAGWDRAVRQVIGI